MALMCLKCTYHENLAFRLFIPLPLSLKNLALKYNIKVK